MRLSQPAAVRACGSVHAHYRMLTQLLEASLSSPLNAGVLAPVHVLPLMFSLALIWGPEGWWCTVGFPPGSVFAFCQTTNVYTTTTHVPTPPHQSNSVSTWSLITILPFPPLFQSTPSRPRLLVFALYIKFSKRKGWWSDSTHFWKHLIFLNSFSCLASQNYRKPLAEVTRRVDPLSVASNLLWEKQRFFSV